MGRREADISEYMELVPQLLDLIRRRSGLRLADVYRRLGAAMGMTPASVKRNWLRWRAVTDEVDERGRLAHSTSLKRLVDAASALGWLKDAHETGCAPLLSLLRDHDKRRHDDGVRSARRRMTNMRRYVREAIRERHMTAFDDVTWMSALFGIVGEELACELRDRLLDGAKDPENPPVELSDELLTGTLGQKVRMVLVAGLRPVSQLRCQVRRMESKVHADFKATMDLNA
jgi:hypothetical protein